MKETYSDEDLVMVSALQHYLFCKRQCALIHIEQVWTENRLTAEGRVLHERVDQREAETRGSTHLATALRLVSHKLGLVGIADMVEFHQVETPMDSDGVRRAVRLPRLKKYWIPFPIEYKHGKPKTHRADEVQLCAQAICLEEMLDCSIFEGALFYGKTRKRMAVPFDSDLRGLTIKVAKEVHELIDSADIPPGHYDKPCDSCSLIDLCHPESSKRKSVSDWIQKEIQNSLGGDQ